MATEAVFPRKAAASGPVYRTVNRTVEHGFFSGMAVLLCVVVVYGFSHTYFTAGMVLAPLPNLLIHVHGAAFTLWMVLYVTQTALISAKRVAWHRTLGPIAFCLPPLMVVLGICAALDGLRRGSEIGGLDPATSLAIPLFGIACFAVLIYAAWSSRRRPDAHKRLILIATMAICEAALGRFPWPQVGVPVAVGPWASEGVLLLFIVGYDLIVLRRLHRTTMWAAPLTFVVAAGAVPFGFTPLWHSFAGFLARDVAPHV
jgi:hypothetical protein